MLSNTKDRIADVALKLFAENGYEAVSVSDIASGLGITKGALYRHYESKRDIFMSIVGKMDEWDEEKIYSYKFNTGLDKEMTEKYKNTPVYKLMYYSKAQFRLWTENRQASQFRKVLTLERYRDSEMRELFDKYFTAGPMTHITHLFAEIGISNAGANALLFYSPVFMGYSLYDSADQKGRITAIIDDHIDKITKGLGLR